MRTLEMRSAIQPHSVRIRREVVVPIRADERAVFISFDGLEAAAEHFAVRYGNRTDDVPFVRMHSECITGDLFRSLKCDCGSQLEEAVNILSARGGLLLYLRQEGRGIGLYSKLDAYALQERGFDTFEANVQLHLPVDARDYRCAAQMLTALNISRIKLLTNNPDKRAQLQACGIEVVETIPTGVFVNPHNERYLLTKAKKGAHLLQLDEH